MATIEQGNDIATLTACDPHSAADDAKITSAGDVLDVRVFLLFNAFDADIPSNTATCVADRLSVDRDVTTSYQNDNPSDADLQRITQKPDDAEAACPA